MKRVILVREDFKIDSTGKSYFENILEGIGLSEEKLKKVGQIDLQVIDFEIVEVHEEKKEVKKEMIVKTERGWGVVEDIQYDEDGNILAVEIFYDDNRPGRRVKGQNWPGGGTAFIEDIEKIVSDEEKDEKT